MRRKGFLTLLAAVSFSASCTFDNDMSYPPLQGQITAFAVEGQKSVNIDAETQSVEVLLEETADIDALKVLEFEISEKTTTEFVPGASMDLSEPVDVLLKTYPGQEYMWTVSASQPIERYVRCSGMIDAVFDAKNQKVLVSVIEKQPLEDIVFEAMKLGPETSKIISTAGHDNAGSGVITRAVEFPMMLDCTLDRKFTVLYKGVEYVWTMTCVQRAILNEIKTVDAWTYHAVVTGDYNGEGTPYYEYRKVDEQEWTRWDEVTVDGVTVTADITGLQDDTEYAVRLVSDVFGAEFTFKTDCTAQLPGMGFNDWYYGGSNGKTWYPYFEGDPYPCWDTANPGVSSLIENTTVPEYEHKVEGDAAAKMVSSYAVVKFAAGNIFSGKFAKFQSFTAYLDWGIPFTSRPYALTGWYDYNPGIVDNVDKAKYPDMLGKPDFMHLQVVLVADEEAGPIVVDSSKPEKLNFKTDPRVIAHSEIVSDVDTDGYIEFELPLVYRDSRTPAYAIIVASASYRGDYFTGAVGSTLYVDGFQFTYR